MAKSKTEIKNTNKLIIQGQEFEMSIQDLRDLRDAIDKVIGEKVRVIPASQPIIFPDRKEPIDESEPFYPKIKPYKPWRTEDESYPRIWMNDDNSTRIKDRVTVSMNK